MPYFPACPAQQGMAGLFLEPCPPPTLTKPCMTIDNPDTMVLFTARVSRATLTRVEGQELVIETWTPSDGLREIRRN